MGDDVGAQSQSAAAAEACCHGERVVGAVLAVARRAGLSLEQRPIGADSLGKRGPEGELGRRERAVSGDCALRLRHFSVGLHPRDAVGQHPIGLQRDPRIGEHMANDVILQRRLSIERHAAHLLNVAIKDANQAGGSVNTRSFEIERRHRRVPASVHFTDDLMPGHAHFVHEDFIPATPPEHVIERPQRDAGHLVALIVFELHSKVRDAAMLGRLGVRPYQHVVPVGEMRAGRPYLLAGDDKIIAVLHAACGQRGEVRAGVRLRESLRPVDGVVAHAGEEVFLHPVRAMNHDCARDVGLRLRGGGVVIGQLL